MKENNLSLDLRGANLAKNTIYNFFGLAIPYAVAFVSIPYIIHKLGIERFGILSLAWVVIGYFSLVDLGLARATIKYISEALGRGKAEEVPKYFWTTVILQCVLGIIGTFIFLIFTPFLVNRIINIPHNFIGEAKATFQIMSFALPIVLLSSSFRGVLEASQKFNLVNMIKIPVSIAMYLMPMLGGILGFNLPGIVGLFLVIRIISMIAWFMFCLRIFPNLRFYIHFNKAIVKLLLKFGGWVTLSSLLFYIMSSADRFIIASLLSIKELAYYSAPLEIINKLGIIPASLSMILFPAFSAFSGRNEEDRSKELFIRSIKYILLGIGPLALLFVYYSKPFLGFWLGPLFADKSSYIFQLLCIGFVISSLCSIPYNYLFGIGKIKLIVVIQFAEILFYLPLSLILIKKWGINGAGIALCIKAIVITSLYFLVSYKIRRIEYKYFIKFGVHKTIISFFLFFISMVIISKLNLNLIGFIIIVIIIIIITYFYIFNRDEQQYLSKLFIQINKRIPGK